MQDAFDKMDADHIHELQAGGLDMASNMWMLDSGVNRSVGSQINNTVPYPRELWMEVLPTQGLIKFRACVEGLAVMG